MTGFAQRLAERLLKTPERKLRSELSRGVLLGVVLLALGLAPLTLSPHSADVLAAMLLGLGAVVAAAAGAGATVLLRVLTAKEEVRFAGGKLSVPLPAQTLAKVHVRLLLLRRVGLALPALAFFGGWALIYTLVWAHAPGSCPVDITKSCAGAFRGAGQHPMFGIFLYLAVQDALGHLPPDLTANSQLARMLTTLELLSGVAALSFYARSFFGLRDTERKTADSAPAADDVSAASSPAER